MQCDHPFGANATKWKSKKKKKKLKPNRQRTPHAESNDITQQFRAHLNPSTSHSLLATVSCVHIKLYTVAVRVHRSYESERDSNSNVCLAGDRGIRIRRTRERDNRMHRIRRIHNWRLFSIGSAPSNRIATMLNCTNYLFHLIICAWMPRRSAANVCEWIEIFVCFFVDLTSAIFTSKISLKGESVCCLRSFIVSDVQTGVLAFCINLFSDVCRVGRAFIDRTDEESRLAAILKIEMKIESCAFHRIRINKLFLFSYFLILFFFLSESFGLWGNKF